MNFGGGGRPQGTVRCKKYYSTCLTVIPWERCIQCPQCCHMTRLRRHQRIPLLTMPMPMAPMGFACGRGKKRAVLIGISYAGIRRGGCAAELRGPINDVKCWI